MRKKALYLYLIASTEQNKKSHTYIGCTANFWRRLKQHNGELHGGPPAPRVAASDFDAHTFVGRQSVTSRHFQ